MKTKVVTILLILLGMNTFAQISNGINYQTIIRNNEGEIYSNQSLSLQISIIQGSINGDVVYTETHDLQSNGFGMVSLTIGSGNTQSGNFGSIQWGNSRVCMQSKKTLPTE